MREVVGDADRVDAGDERRIIGDALDLAAVDEDAGREPAERLAIGGRGHHGASPGFCLAMSE